MLESPENIPPWLQKLSRWVIRDPKIKLVALALAALLVSTGAAFLELDPSTERIFPKGHIAVKNFQDFRTTFGNDEFLLIAYTGKEPILSRNELTRLQILSDKLLKLTVKIGPQKNKILRPVRAVRSLTNTPNVLMDLSTFPPKPKISKLYNKPIKELSDTELANANSSILKSPFVKPLLLSPDGLSTSLVLELNQPKDMSIRDAAEQVMELVREARVILKSDIIDQGLEGHVAGSPVVKVDIVETIEKELLIFTLPLILISALVSFFIFKTLRGVLLPMAVIIITSLFVYGTMGYLGLALHPMTTLLSPLLFVVGIADSIHVIVEIENCLAERKENGTLYDAILRSTIIVLPPCFVTSLTTSIGFGSLVLSDIAPVAEFGFLAALGTSLAFIVTFLLIPPLWLLLPDHAAKTKKEAPRVDRLASFVMRTTKILAIISILFGAFCISKIPDISFNTDFVGFFKEESAIQKGVKFIQTRFAGIGAIEIVVKAKPKELRTPKTLQAILDFEQSLLNDIPEVDSAFSCADFLVFARKKINGKKGVPSIQEINLMERLFAGMAGEKNEIRRFISADESQTRISVRVKTMGSERMSEILKQIRTLSKSHLSSSTSVIITGTPVIFSETAYFMMEGQMRSFFWALLTITLVMIVSLRSLRLGLLSLVPNLFPIAVTFGFMALFEIPLNSFNSMVASVAIGIAVDDTIHVLIGYQRYRSTMPMELALKETIAHTGAAVLSTSLLLASGFGVLMLGNFKPTGHFGFLTSVAIISAVIGDLFLLPALIILDEKIFGSCVNKKAKKQANES
jgi:uncharacterized protein